MSKKSGVKVSIGIVKESGDVLIAFMYIIETIRFRVPPMINAYQNVKSTFGISMKRRIGNKKGSVKLLKDHAVIYKSTFCKDFLLKNYDFNVISIY